MAAILAYIVIEAAALGAALGIAANNAVSDQADALLLFGLAGAAFGAVIGAGVAWTARNGLRTVPAWLPLYALTPVTGWTIGAFVFWQRAGIEGADGRPIATWALLGTLPGAVIGFLLARFYATPRHAARRNVLETPAAVAGTPLATVRTLSEQIGEVRKLYPHARGDIAPLDGNFVATITLNELRFYVTCPPGYPAKAPQQTLAERVDSTTGEPHEIPLVEKRLMKEWTKHRTLTSVVITGLEMVGNGGH